MGTGTENPPKKTSLWHESFYECVSERAPPGFEVLSEFPLSRRPRRVDLLLLRRRGAPRHDDQAKILKGLWSRLPRVTLLELKSPSRGLRRSDLVRLLAYGMQYQELYWREVTHHSELALVLVVPGPSKALTDELASVGCHLRPLSNGYAQLVGFLYTCYVVFTDEVSEAERDDYLRVFSHHAVQTPEAQHWLEHWIVGKETMANAREREGYDEMLGKLLDSLPPERILRRYKPEERLAGLAPEERLAGLAREQQILALPDEVLRALSEDYIRSLPHDVQQTIRQRLDRGK